MSIATPRLAATLVVVRDTLGASDAAAATDAPTTTDASAGLQVLLLQRAERGDHNSGAWVFPGGLVDAGDDAAQPFCNGPDEAQACHRLGLEAGGLAHYIAAVRETFEEAGLLFATHTGGQPVDLQGELGPRLAACRGALHRGELAMADFCRQFDLRLRTDQLHYLAHWITPVGRAKRFDTRFFVAVLPPGQASAFDAVETVQQVWITPAQALAPENTRRLMTPTRAMLEQMAAFASTAALLAWAGTPRPVPRVLPRLASGPEGIGPIMLGHPAWDEVGQLDPTGRGDVWSEVRPGALQALSAGVRRLTAADGGHHSYLVACGADAWAVIDPGPCVNAHLDALQAATPGALRWICLTDSDTQQAQAAAALQARTGAQVLGPRSAMPAELTPHLLGLASTDTQTMNYLLASEGLLFTGARPLPADAHAAHGVAWLAPRQGFLTRASAGPNANANAGAKA